MNNKKARVIAFYLPQFHPIKENDECWGKGFTEWNNVVQAKPLFRGHYQPRLPADLGFYDLRLPEIREQQAELAREAGIEGFMYWHYYFGNDRTLLERPFQEVLNSGKPDFPFCLGWANHSWQTKTWRHKTFQKQEMIMEMLYPGKEDYINHFNYCLPAFKDERYITVDGKPIFTVFAPTSIPNAKEFIEIWRELAIKSGLKGIHFVGNMTGRTITLKMLKNIGFDAVIENRMWHAEAAVMGAGWKRRLKSLLSYKMGSSLAKFDYAEIIKYLGSQDMFDESVYPSIIPGFDRSARAGKHGVIYYNSTPDLFRKHVHDIIKYVENKNDEHKIIFLKSWNEWGEGNYVEPDLKYGHGFIQALSSELR